MVICLSIEYRLLCTSIIILSSTIDLKMYTTVSAAGCGISLNRQEIKSNARSHFSKGVNDTSIPV